MSELISRLAAIDGLARVASEKFKFSDEFNYYLAGLIDGENAIRQLPSAQPELVRCKDCKHYYALNEVRGNCSEYNFVEKIPIDFCSWAERKEE